MDPDMFGKPNEGFHATRFLGMAFYDILGTIVFALLTSYFWKVPILYSLLGWFVFGEVAHLLVGVNTAFTKLFILQ